jgi:hypothetical protein
MFQNQNQQKPRRKRRTKAEMELNQTEHTPISEKSGSGRKGWESVVRQQLNDLWGMIAVSITFVNPIDAQIVAERAPKITEAIIHIAQAKPAFRKMLLRTSESVLYVELIASIAPIAILIAVNHKLLPPFVAFAYGGMPKQDTNTNGNDDTFDFSTFISNTMETGRTPNNNRTDGFG